MSEESISSPRWTAGAVFRGAFVGAAAGAVANVALYLLAPLAGVSLLARFRPDAPPQSLLFVAVVLASLVPALPAALAALLLGRVTREPARAFAALAAVFGLLSMGGPMNLAEASLGLKVLLAVMHVVSGVGITAGVLRSAR